MIIIMLQIKKDKNMQYRTRIAYEIYQFLTRKVNTSCPLVTGNILAHGRWKPKKNYGHFNNLP